MERVFLLIENSLVEIKYVKNEQKWQIPVLAFVTSILLKLLAKF